uniref:Uncharacterized protein n=1 Tax=Serinus canaria TaxID=9135 RepID=A0A8C9NNN3_SERCA
MRCVGRGSRRHAAVQEGLPCSNARIMASMNHILEQYIHPFQDDILISMASLTYNEPDGFAHGEYVTRKTPLSLNELRIDYLRWWELD